MRIILLYNFVENYWKHNSYYTNCLKDKNDTIYSPYKSGVKMKNEEKIVPGRFHPGKIWFLILKNKSEFGAFLKLQHLGQEEF